MIDALEKSATDNAKAVQICNESNLSLKAQQQLYKNTVSTYVLSSLNFPFEAKYDASKNKVSSHLAQIEDEFKSAYTAAYKNAQGTAKQQLEILRSDVDGIRDTGEKIAKTIRVEIDRFEVGFVNLYSYAPTLVSAAYMVRSDLQTLELQVNKLKADLDAAVTAASGQLDDLINLKDDTVVKAISAVRATIQLFKDLRNGVPDRSTFDQYFTQAQVDKVKEALKIVIRYRAAKLAVNRLERELYVIEGKLAQIDEKAWFAISVAQLLFTDAIRDAVTAEQSDQLLDPNDVGTKTKKSLENLTAAKTNATFDAGEDPDNDPTLWLFPIATVACERVMRTVENTDVTAARTDQLLNPIYLFLINRFWEKSKPTVAESIQANNVTNLAGQLKTAAELLPVEREILQKYQTGKGRLDKIDNLIGDMRVTVNAPLQ